MIFCSLHLVIFIAIVIKLTWLLTMPNGLLFFASITCIFAFYLNTGWIFSEKTMHLYWWQQCNLMWAFEYFAWTNTKNGMLTIYFEKTSQVTVTCLERFDSEWRVYFQIWFRRGGSVVIVLCRILYCPCPKPYGCNTKLDPQLSSSLAFFL